MFKKKDEDLRSENSGLDLAPPLKPFSKNGSHTPTKSAGPSAAGASHPTEIPRRVADIPGIQRRADQARNPESDGKTLTVGREICLSGDITSCDTLVVEGRIEAVLNDARVINVSETGLFIGEAKVAEAEISGRFEGTLTAMDVLTVRPGGKIKGKIRYSRIIIEAGGEVSGDIASLNDDQDPKPGT